jgi:hypothetical protein
MSLVGSPTLCAATCAQTPTVPSLSPWSRGSIQTGESLAAPTNVPVVRRRCAGCGSTRLRWFTARHRAAERVVLPCPRCPRLTVLCPARRGAQPGERGA